MAMTIGIEPSFGCLLLKIEFSEFIKLLESFPINLILKIPDRAPDRKEFYPSTIVRIFQDD